MNYLAHLLLAEDTPESLIGNFLGDFVKGTLEGQKNCYSEGILKGIRTHRHIDSFTDSHSIYRNSKRRISANQRHCSGIVIDVCYDHFLSRHWTRFSESSLNEFIAKVYRILHNHQELLPQKLQNVLPRMIAENWLGTYQHSEGVGLTLTRISRRLRRQNSLATAQDDFLLHYDELERDFLAFFPALLTYTEQNRHSF